jgi:hypothetical protein
MNSISIVGTISNVGNKVEKDLSRVMSSFRKFKILSVYLVESDSNDNTINVLQKMKKKDNKIDFISKGKLRELIPDRVDRIRHCRNVYVSYLRSLPENEYPDFVAVVDLDGMNSKLTCRAIKSSFNTLDWDVVTANQSGGYYDIFALRADGWQVGNCFDELQKLKNEIVSKLQTEYKEYSKFQIQKLFDQARVQAIYCKMRKIDLSNPWISVSSAFGGLAIYKSYVFKKYDYGNSFKNNNSEHVEFHEKITKSGGKIFINPAMINCRWNTYNVNRFFFVRQIRLYINKNAYYSFLRSIQLKKI